MAEECPFCAMDPATVLSSNKLAFSIPDRFPISRGHCLIIPKRHICSFFEATAEEKAALADLLEECRDDLAAAYAADGFNIGINDGPAAGQTIMHLHIHLIPRYSGDVDDPRGGVRWIKPDRAPYWQDDSRSKP